MEMNLNVWSLVFNAGPMVKFVLLILVIGSIASWAIIFYKARALTRIAKESSQFQDLFWETPNLSNINSSCAEFPNTPLARQFEGVYAEIVNIRKNAEAAAREGQALHTNDISRVKRILDKTCTIEKAKMEYTIGFLATAGNAAPFIGLFGTVWGIMNSFRSIGEMGAANLAVVAPGISEALIATALGLFVAIPASMGFNQLITKVDRIGGEMDNFSSDLINIVDKMINKRPAKKIGDKTGENQ